MGEAICEEPQFLHQLIYAVEHQVDTRRQQVKSVRTVTSAREAQFPDFDAVKPQIEQRLSQMKLQKFQDDMRKAAKTDYKFAQ